LVVTIKRLERGDESIDERGEGAATGDMTGTIDQRVVPLEQIHRNLRDEVNGVDRYTHRHFGRQFGRRTNSHGDVVAGRDRLAQDVPAERSGRTKNQQTSVHAGFLQRVISFGVPRVSKPPSIAIVDAFAYAKFLRR
jgi:hypothetical protein